MSSVKKQEGLERLDFDAAFPVTPEGIGDAISLAGLDIERRKRTRARRMRRLYVAAAVLVLGIGVAWAAVNLNGKPDSVAPSTVTTREDVDMTVYAAKDDPHYHSMADCPNAASQTVALPLITAREFEKTPCPACMGK